jgi:hypothetical protein
MDQINTMVRSDTILRAELVRRRSSAHNSDSKVDPPNETKRGITMLSPREHEQLCLLAADRANEAITSVTRMLDDDEQALRLKIMVLMALHDTTTLQMVETARLPDGTEPSFDDCHTRILKAVISGNIADAISDLEYPRPLQ